MKNYLRIYKEEKSKDDVAISEKVEGITPKFSYCVKEASISQVYDKKEDKEKFNNYEYVDLMLPSGTKWARCNVGASKEIQNGLYFQYGKGNKSYQTTSGDGVYRGEENPLANSADTAAVLMLGERTNDKKYLMNWHMPTSDQIKELITNTVCSWVNNYNGSGVKGFKFIGVNKNELFIPASGWYEDGRLSDVGTVCHIWGSTPQDGSSRVITLNGDSSSKKVNLLPSERELGLTIRPVFGDRLVSLRLTNG